MSKSSLLLGGHRGYGCTDDPFYETIRPLDELPVENTLDSYTAAFNAGADYIEADVLMSADGVLFAAHLVKPQDHFFDAARFPQAFLNELPFENFRHYPTGRLRKGTITRLEEVLHLAAERDPKTADWALVIELKGVQDTKQSYEQNDYLQRAADAVLSSSLPPERVLWSSFCLENIIRMSHLCPKSAFAMLFAEYGEMSNLYTTYEGDLNYKYLPFHSGTIKVVLDEWLEKAPKGAPHLYLHPEISTITEETVDCAVGRIAGMNSWPFKEKLDETRLTYYARRIKYIAQKNIPFTVITDYIPEMRKAFNIT